MTQKQGNFLRELEVFPHQSVEHLLAKSRLSRSQLDHWRAYDEEFLKAYTESSSKRKDAVAKNRSLVAMPQTGEGADESTIRLALAEIQSNPLAGISAATRKFNLSTASFFRAVNNNSTLKMLYEVAISALIEPVEQKFVDVMVTSDGAQRSRQRFLDQHLPGIYGVPNQPAQVHIGDTNIQVIARDFAASMPRAERDGEGRFLPADVPIEALDAGDGHNVMPALFKPEDISLEEMRGGAE